MKIILRAKHFKNTEFSDHACGCAIEKAVKELFPSAKMVVEGIDFCRIDGQTYLHEAYTPGHFDDDMVIAKDYNFDDTIIHDIIFR